MQVNACRTHLIVNYMFKCEEPGFEQIGNKSFVPDR